MLIKVFYKSSQILLILLIIHLFFTKGVLEQGSYPSKQEYDCYELGDFLLSPSNCQPCRGIFPGCKRCGIDYEMEKRRDLVDNSTTYAFFRCLSCDEGMHLYPVKNETTGTIAHTCVPDCPTVNMWTINNPKNGRCEFLGYYCLYGNLQEGCLESYGPGNFTTLINRTIQGIEGYYGTPNNVVEDKFKVSSLIQTADSVNQGQVKDCFIQGVTSDLCQICKPGYVSYNKTYYQDSYDVTIQNYVRNEWVQNICVLNCPTGTYPNITFIDNPLQMNMGSQNCSSCNEKCYTCLLVGAQNCTSCKPAYYLNILHAGASSGECIIKNQTQSEQNLIKNIIVRGNRSEEISDFTYPDFMSALARAYQEARNYANLTINIFINPEVEHFIIMNDIFQTQVQWQDVLDATFDLNILPQGCSKNECTKNAVIYNKVGPFFQIPVPQHGLYIRNIKIDSIDSVLDHLQSEDHLNCLNNFTALCCFVNPSIRYVGCQNLSLPIPKLNASMHQFQECFVRPRTGLFSMMLIDENGKRSQPINYSITIQSCEFKNFFYELGSLVKMPVLGDQIIEPQPIDVSINIINSSFIRWNTGCGNIITNKEDLNITDAQPNPKYPSSQFSPYFYWLYQKTLEDSYYQYIKRFYSSQSLRKEPNPNYVKLQSKINLKLQLIHNVFDGMNYLRNRGVDPYRTQYAQSTSYRHNMFLNGHIVDLYSLQNSTIHIFGNKISNVISNSTRYCYSMSQNEETHYPYYFFDKYPANQGSRMYQRWNIFTFQNSFEERIIIQNNHFYNISTIGALILVRDNKTWPIRMTAIINNTFQAIFQGWDVGVFQFEANYDSNNPFYSYVPDRYKKLNEILIRTNDNVLKDEVLALIQTGGKLIKDNYFNQIATICQYSSIQFTITEMTRFYETSQSSYAYYYRWYYKTTQPINSNQKIDRDYIEESFKYLSKEPMTFYPNSDFFTKESDKMVLVVDPYRVTFLGNSYEDVYFALGLYGSLHFFGGISAVDFANEKYQNIGSRISEVFNRFSNMIFNFQDIKIENPSKLPPYFPGNGFLTGFNQGSYQQDAPLIICDNIGSFKILGNSSFQNIWRLDRNNAMKQGGQIWTGFIFQILNSAVSIQIGGDYVSSSGISYKGTVSFGNLIGYINEHSAKISSNFTLKNLAKFNIDINSIDYGLGTMLFSVHQQYNFIRNLTIQNCKFDKIYTNPVNDSTIEDYPMIMLTDVQNQPPDRILNQITIKNCVFTNLTYERGTAYLILIGKQVLIENVTFKDIGRLNIIRDTPFWQGTNRSYQIRKHQTGFVPILQLHFERKINQVTTLSNNILDFKTVISNSRFENLDQYTSLPVMMFGTYQKINPRSHSISVINCSFSQINDWGQDQPLSIVYDSYSTLKIYDFSFIQCTFDGIDMQCKYNTAVPSNCLCRVSAQV